MTLEKAFRQLVSQYCMFSPDELTGEKRFREDLDFSSLDFMSFLGELEDEFDVELEQDKIIQDIQSEQAILTYGVLAGLKGLKEQGCDGPVTEAIQKIEKHLNERAHEPK